MKKRMSTAIALVLGSSLLLAGCGSSSEGGDADSAGGSFTYRMPDRQMAWLNDQKWLPLIEEETGLDVELVDGGPQDKYFQTIDLEMTSGGIGDAAIVSLAQKQVYGPQGAFVDLAPLIEESAPHIQQYLDDNPDYRSLVTDPDGSIYGLILERPRIGAATFFRSDMFEKAGLADPPRTIDELTEAMRALKATYGPDFYPMTGRDFFMNLLYAFGANFTIDDKGKTHGIYDESPGLSFDVKSPGFREAVEWYQGIYEEGLIDPIWVEGSMSEEDWQSQMLTGGSAISTDFFTRPSWFLANGGPENDPAFAMDVLMPFEDESGEQLIMPSNAQYDPSRIFAIDARSKKAEAIVKMLDFLYTEEGQTLLHYGVEGETFEVEDGEPKYLVRYDEVADSPVGTPVWAFHQDRISYPAPVDNDAYYAFLDDFTGSYAGELFSDYTEPHPVIRYTPEQQEQRSAIRAALQPAMIAGFTDFVTGDRDLAEWDGFVAELDALGYSDLAKIDATAVAAMNG